MKFKLFLLAIALPMFIVSCSDDKDDPVTPIVTANYYPMMTNNYWIYDTYTLDMTNNPQLDTKEKDSLVISSKEMFLEKEAYLFKQFTDNTLKADRHFVLADKILYAESNYILPLSSSFALPLDKITNQWITLANFNSGSWNILSYKFLDEPLTLPGVGDVKLNADYTVTGTQSSSEVAIMVAGVSKNCKEIVVKHKIAGTIATLVSIPLDFTITQKYYFADGIGLTKVITESQKVSISIPFLGTQSFDIEGHIKNLINYKIN